MTPAPPVVCRDYGAPSVKPTGLLLPVQGPAWDVMRFARALPWESAGCCGRFSCANQNLFALDGTRHLEQGWAQSPAAALTPAPPAPHPPLPSPHPHQGILKKQTWLLPWPCQGLGQRPQQVAICSAGPS